MRARALWSVLTVALPWAAIVSSGCTTDSFNDCKAGTASRAECEAACRDEDPSPDWCSAYLQDGGTTDADTDAGPEDGGTDAGPCGGGCAPDEVCDEMAGECVGCRDDGDCGPDAPVCDTEGSRTCVGCLAQSDCTDPAASRCDTVEKVCVPCTTPEHCVHLDNLGLCDTSSDPAECVECTAEDASACGGTVCDVRARSCSDQMPASAGLCAPCVSDAQCTEGKVCVEMGFGDPAETVGAFCLWRLDAASGPDGSCFSVRPYVEAQERVTTVSGEMVDVCGLALTTCPALRDFRSEECSAPDTGDDECGVMGLDDGVCVAADASTNRCSVRCGSDDDCPETISSCDTSEGIPGVCEL